MQRVSFIVVSYRNKSDIPILIGSIDAAVGSSDWILTIVNNEIEDNLDEILAYDTRIKVINAGQNLGYSGGLNLGIESSQPADFTVFLNPDVTLQPGSVAHLLHELEAGADAAVPKLIDRTGARQNSLRTEPSLRSAIGEAVFGNAWSGRPQWLSETVRDPRAYQYPHDVDWATGAILAVRRSTLIQNGPWDSARFFLYSEETDYARRIRARGGRIRFVPNAVVQHRGSGSGSSPQLDALQELNKVVYFRKWNGSVAAVAFRAFVLLRNVLRPHRPGARAAVRPLLLRSARAELPGGTQ